MTFFIPQTLCPLQKIILEFSNRTFQKIFPESDGRKWANISDETQNSINEQSDSGLCSKEKTLGPYCQQSS